MKAVTKYRADDGAEFADAAACATYESLVAEIAEVMRALPPPPKDDGCRFSNGYGYIQHDRATFLAARLALLRIAQRVCPFRWIDESIADSTVHPSWAARIIGESSRPLARAWRRIECTDSQMREWGQPYYATHPDKAPELARLNAESAS